MTGGSSHDNQYKRFIKQHYWTVCHELTNAKLEALPDINLYMDQVITFMEKELYPTKRHEEDPILTKTMVNNYVKK
mgnify:CR=1 FL=1